jgi:hypothetical protein
MTSQTNHLLISPSFQAKKIKLAATVLAAISALPLMGQAPAQPATQAPIVKTDPASTTYEPSHFPRRECSYYRLFWGVDSLSVKAVESGELIKFSYRVLDADKAKTLNDKSLDPAMYVPALHAKLVIPSLEKVGQLRQAATPEPGRYYWMAFSNPGGVVKKGDRVSVVIGQFHIDGLVVE